MVELYRGCIPIIDDEPAAMALAFPDGDDTPTGPQGATLYGRGYVPRDYDEYPEEMFDSPDSMKTYSESEWDALFDEQEKYKSSLEHLYLPDPNKPAFLNLDQNGQGYCWMYSSVHSIMMARLRDNQPYVRLSAHAAACKVKNYANRGGWCGESAEFLRAKGVPSVEFWKEKSMSRQYDKPATWENAKKHRILENYTDLTKRIWNQSMNKRQLATALFNNLPCPTDYNWWGHSVCAIRWVRVERGSWGILILNSWARWGRHGLSVLRGSKTNFAGAVCTRTTGGSVK